MRAIGMGLDLGYEEKFEKVVDGWILDYGLGNDMRSQIFQSYKRCLWDEYEDAFFSTTFKQAILMGVKRPPKRKR